MVATDGEANNYGGNYLKERRMFHTFHAMRDFKPTELNKICFWIGSILTGSVVAMALGDEHSLVLKQDGSVWSTAITLNNIPYDNISNHFMKMITSGAIAVAAGNHFSIVLKDGGSVWSMGLGGGKPLFKDTFCFVRVIIGAKAVVAGGRQSMVLTESGDVWAAGCDKYQLGASRNILRKTMSGAALKAVGIAAGEDHSIVLKQDGSVWAAGRNQYGQLGDGSKTDRNTFVNVMPSGAVSVAAGGSHSMVLKQDGSVWVAGWNEYGQLGDGSTIDQINYMQVMSSGAKSMTGGTRYSMILKQDGSVWATGCNECGQLGAGGAPGSIAIEFFQVIPDGVKAIAAGACHSMVVKQDGSVWAAGSNEFGQIGDNSTTHKETFVRLTSFDNGSLYDLV